MRLLVKMAWGLLASQLALACAAEAKAPARGGPPEHPPVQESLVRDSERMGEQEARMTLARLLAQDELGLAEARRWYEMVLAADPGQVEARLELAGLLARLGEKVEAAGQLQTLLREHPQEPTVLLAVAELEASQGHAKSSRQEFTRALEQLPPGPKRWEAELRLAAAANLWGDFYQVESIYRRALERAPGDPALRIKLAETLTSSQRYDEAEQEYLLLMLDENDCPECLAGIAEARYRRGDFTAALARAEDLLKAHPGHRQGLLVLAGSLLKLSRIEESGATYQGAIRFLGRKADLLLGLGRVRSAQGRAGEAKALFDEAARLAPKSAEARFRQVGVESATRADFLDDLTAPGRRQALELVEWGELYAREGLRPQAIACYRAALREDGDCFPARMNLAETLAADQQFSPALEELRRLDQDTPMNRKVLLARARALSWGRDYQGSREIYRQIGALNSRDPLPVMEAARVAAWGKMMDRAQELYASLARPAVDDRLAQGLRGLARSQPFAGSDDHQSLQQLASQVESGRTYAGYEQVGELAASLDLSSQATVAVERLRLGLWAEYHIQKAALLEGRAKKLAWDKRFSRGAEELQELVAFQPGNQEAWFDLSQAQCALGRREQEGEAYRRLLTLDPLHTLAGHALRGQTLRGEPALRAGYQYWKEVGRGELSQMERSRADLGFDIPLAGNLTLGMTGHRWLESPLRYGRSAEAFGQTIGLAGQFAENFRGEASWTRKEYQRADLAARDNGQAALWYNYRDLASLGLGFTREDLLTNAFALSQGLQRDSWWLGVKSDLNRQWSLEGRATALDYSDGNRGAHYSLALGRAFSDHPRTFKVWIKADYRDTDQPDLYRYSGDRLLDIIHPYWSPQDNLAGTLVLEWRHDLAELFICGARQHYYDLRLSLGEDTENNPSLALEGTWHYQLAERWTAEAQGLVHRSREWDAQGMWLNLMYRF